MDKGWGWMHLICCILCIVVSKLQRITKCEAHWEIYMSMVRRSAGFSILAMCSMVLSIFLPNVINTAAPHRLIQMNILLYIEINANITTST